MKPSILSTIIVTFLVTACSGYSTAQSFPVPSTIRTPYGNVTTYTYRMPLYYGGDVTSGKYNFHVVFKNDSVAKISSRIDVSDSVHHITYKKKGEKITILPTDTKNIYRISSTGKKVMGFPTDSCWLFLVDKGKINSYSFVSELGLNYIIAIQHGDDGEIVPLTKDNLMQLAGKNEKLIKLIEKEKFYRAISLYNNSHDDSNEKKAPDVHLRHKK